MSVPKEKRTVVAAFEQKLMAFRFKKISPPYVVTPQKKASLKAFREKLEPRI